jgi:hypothetical protein
MLSRKSDTTFGQGTIPELSTSHIGKGVALVALAAAFVYIYARIPQIAEMTLSFHATHAHEVHAGEMHAYEVHHEVHAHEVYAREAHAYEVPNLAFPLVAKCPSNSTSILPFLQLRSQK